MDSATNDATVWITLLVLGNGAIACMLLISLILAFCSCKYRDQERYCLNLEFGKCCIFTCRFTRYMCYVIILSLFWFLLPSILFSTVNIVICQSVSGSPCQALSGTYFSLAIVLLFLYVICLIACSRPTCTCGNWRYRRNSRIRHRRQAASYGDDQDLPVFEYYDRLGEDLADQDYLSTHGLHYFERRFMRDEYDSATVIDNRFLDPVLPEYSFEPQLNELHLSETHLPKPRQPETRQPEPRQPEPRQPEPHQPEPYQPEPRHPEPRQPEPHQPEPRQPEPHQPEPRQPELHPSEPCKPEPHQPEPHQPEPHQPEPHQPEPHQPEPHQPEPCQPEYHVPELHLSESHQHEHHLTEFYLPHQKIGNSSTESGCSHLDLNQETVISCGELSHWIPSPSAVSGVDISKHITQTCFILGDVHTLPITHQGGTFPLHPFGPCGGEQQVECCATLEAPPGVVGSGVTVSVHYAIILDGPFEFPEKWERTSVVLYIDCPDSRFLIERFTVNLHHWAVSSGITRMCFMKSSHHLQKGQTEFTFKRHANVIPSQLNMASVYLKDHFCLVCVAAESDTMVMSRYYGILLSDPLKDRVERFWLCIAYAVPSWVKAIAEYYRRREGSEGYREIPEYDEIPISNGNKVIVDIEDQSGLGWTLLVTKKEVLLTEVNTLSRYTSCREKETAVRVGFYPPSIKFTVMYKVVPSPDTHEPIQNFAHLSSEGGDAIKLFFTVQNQNAKDPIVPSAAISDANMSANGPWQVAWTEPTDYNPPDEHYGEPSKPLTVQHLMPYINDLADQVVSISGWLGMGSDLEVIRRTFGMITPEEQLQELLKKWIEDTERPTAPHTWEYFVRVVQGVRKGHVADRIVEDVFTDGGLPSDPVALEKYVVSKMADNWYRFGTHLGLPEDILKTIAETKLLVKSSTRCLVMFQRWIEEIGPVENKMDKIKQAMEEVLKVTGDEKSGMTPVCESEQGEGASPISNDAIPAWVEKMADNWFNFGIALGFSEEDLQSIKDLNDDDVACCSAMMYRWLRTGDRREKTHERLLRAEKEATPPVVPNGMSPEPPPYAEYETVDPEVPHFILKV